MRARVVGVLAAVLTAMVMLVPGVAAAAPANDHFADREVLSGALPIEVTRSNDGATKEVGEFLDFLAPAGRSVWFEWEATFSGWATIGSCDADFRHGVVVYTGTAIGSLTKLGGPGSGEGPNCPYSYREYTVEVEEGTKYEIAVDGNMFTPGGPPPDTEGTFTLRIEPTPAPPNDDFAAAAVLAGAVYEEPDGRRPYFAEASGYNWGATDEAGEPDHEGDPGGASVWYSWVAPESGSARIGVCCGAPNLIAVYRGSSFATLTPLEEAGAAPFGYPVQAGAIYRIAVDGPFVAGAAQLGSFQLQVFMELAPGPGYGVETPAAEPPPNPSSPLDLAPPQTTMRKRSIHAGLRKAAFRFVSSEPGSRFRCRLDGKPLRSCKSPVRFNNLSVGKHAFRVFAIDAAGNADPTPATARFRITG